jgi:hypothetical protein
VRIAESLRRRKIDAFSASEERTLGFNDKQHFEKARELEAAIFTHDPHFIEIAGNWIKSGKEHYGLIFAEMHRFSIEECIRRLALFVELISSEEMVNRIEFL